MTTSERQIAELKTTATKYHRCADIEFEAGRIAQAARFNSQHLAALASAARIASQPQN